VQALKGRDTVEGAPWRHVERVDCVKEGVRPGEARVEARVLADGNGASLEVGTSLRKLTSLDEYIGELGPNVETRIDDAHDDVRKCIRKIDKILKAAVVKSDIDGPPGLSDAPGANNTLGAKGAVPATAHAAAPASAPTSPL
jgi:hypothetical protein